VQIQQEEKLGLMVKSSWAEALIKGLYAVRGGGAVTACQRGRIKSACTKRVETKESHCERNGEDWCKEKAKGEGEHLVRGEVYEVSCSQR
jgi:hypothetical protein